VLWRIQLKGREAQRNNWVISNQWDMNAPLGFSDCLAASFSIHCYESGQPIIPGSVRLIKAKAPAYFLNGQTTVPEMFEMHPASPKQPSRHKQ